MVDINIGNGQGITQAIRDKIGAANIKNKDAATWQKVVAEVNSAQNSKSIFKSGDNYTTDSTKLNEKSTYQSNFVVDQGTVTIDDSVWSKIQNLLTGGNETTKAAAETKQKTLRETANENTIGDLKLTKEPVAPDMSLKPNIGHIDVAPQATGKQLNRMVNGQKQAIEISHDKDGNKVRYAVNDDGTRGEQLVTVTTAGKNTYVTKSEFDKTVKSALQLGENDEIPKGLNAEYVSIGGEATLVFKGKDGHVMTGSEVKKFMTDYKKDLYDRTAHGSGEYAGKSIKDITNEVVSKMDYSKLDPSFMETALKQDGVQLNYGGQKYTVQQGNLVDAQGNKFSVQNNKLVPVKTQDALNKANPEKLADTADLSYSAKTELTIDGKKYSVEKDGTLVDAQGNKYDVKDGKPVQKENDKAALADVDFTKPENVELLSTFYHPNAQLNFGGTMYTVQQDKTLVDAQGNKYKLENNKPVPIKTSQEPVQTYGKHGNLNVDNDNSGGPFIKNGRLDLE